MTKSAVVAAAAATTLMYNMTLIASTKKRIATQDPWIMPAYRAAIDAADSVIASGMGPWSVMDKIPLPPSGDKHDYMSVGTYFWPCTQSMQICNQTRIPCNTTTGLPWVDCDGHFNTAANAAYDEPALANMSSAVQTLATGYLFSGNVTYATRAALLMRTWFVDPATRMNPNGNFMQAVPGVANGSSFGIIDMSFRLSGMLESLGFLVPSGAWTAADQAAMASWLQGWAQWLNTSALAASESIADNNHQTYFDVMAVSTAVWIGDTQWAVRVLNSTLEPPPAGNVNAPIGVQIWADGELPREEARTNSITYTCMDILGLLRLGVMSRNIAASGTTGAADLLSYVSAANHSSIQATLDFVAPYALGQLPWPHQNIGNSTWSSCYEQFRRAAHAGWSQPLNGSQYAAIADALPGDGLHSPARLFFPWPPA